MMPQTSRRRSSTPQGTGGSCGVAVAPGAFSPRGYKASQSASHKIGELIDGSEVIGGKYILEVSSVGLDRELKTKKDFDRFNGQEARIITRVLIGKDNTFTGIITACDKEAVTLASGKGAVLIPLKDIARARLEIKF